MDYAVIDPATGKAVYDPTLIVFDNEAGQVFDRHSIELSADDERLLSEASR